MNETYYLYIGIQDNIKSPHQYSHVFTKIILYT